MASLESAKLLFIDCQTTGMRPGAGQLLELAWGWPGDSPAESRVIRLPEGSQIPKAVREITGIGPEEQKDAVTAESARQGLLEGWRKAGEPAFAVAHYAQFERPFIEDFFAGAALDPPFRLLCSYRIARRLYPHSPSRSIRGMLGFLDLPFGELRRAGDHVEATRRIWTRLAERLSESGINSLAEVEEWLKAKQRPVRRQFEYHFDRERRLSLPRRPGVYRMLSGSGKVLYVGKATCLRDRVNSYFRGQKGRQAKKLEMLTQVRDISVTECANPLEAALLETDEIKRLDPPYNVSLKAGARSLVFFSRDFRESEKMQTVKCPMGPFRPGGNLDQLRGLDEAVRTASYWGALYELVEPDVLAAAYEIARERSRFQPGSLRSYLAAGMGLVRETRALLASLAEEPAHSGRGDASEGDGEEEGEVGESSREDESEETPLGPEEVADRILHVMERAAEEYLRAKEITRLLDTEITWMREGEEQRLRIRGGRVSAETDREGARFGLAESAGSVRLPWAGLDISDFDRMMVLRSELEKVHPKLAPLSVDE